jgi:hypothetical protein
MKDMGSSAAHFGASREMTTTTKVKLQIILFICVSFRQIDRVALASEDVFRL